MCDCADESKNVWFTLAVLDQIKLFNREWKEVTLSKVRVTNRNKSTAACNRSADSARLKHPKQQLYFLCPVQHKCGVIEWLCWVPGVQTGQLTTVTLLSHLDSPPQSLLILGQDFRVRLSSLLLMRNIQGIWHLLSSHLRYISHLQGASDCKDAKLQNMVSFLGKYLLL